ncbi:hypothetical protein V502_04650 [Pseudogymnoascus sp. VKM F-4520 (FW-2644)]|nr:hypothetical protein V502_04650 [Pseudogymnoascus sp. VKM F-4520 (FW-2644)]
MSSHRYYWFYLSVMALLITYASARAPSEDTPIDQIVSCVYPMSGQYGFLPRLLFYASIIFAFTMRRSGWFTSIVLGLAMSYSATAFVHIIVIYATLGRSPPILDLDVLGMNLLAAVGMSMHPALLILRQRYKSPTLQVVVGCWWYIMLLLGCLITLLLNSFKNLQHNSNSEVACYLPDNTLLTSLAQLNGTRDLECIYDCFLTRKSVLKTQDAVTVMWGNPTNGKVVNMRLTTGAALSSLMFVLGSNMPTYPRIFKRLRRALLFKPVYSVHNQDKHAIMTPMVCISLISIAPWVIITEYSLWRIPVEEMSFAIGQWGPWVAVLFSIIGGAIYDVLEEPKDGEKPPEPDVNTQADYVMSGALVEFSDNIPMDDLCELGSGDDTHLLGDVEIDIGVYRSTPEPER